MSITFCVLLLLEFKHCHLQDMKIGLIGDHVVFLAALASEADPEVACMETSET